MILKSRAAEGTGVFLGVRRSKSGDICLFGNDLRKAKAPSRVAPDAIAAKVNAVQNLLPVN